ncbi:MAG: hypothetical protein QY323_04155 [Patescibacteria group bacterium]|nr:MAG: hypothetical protein QY323_04155 [Patescibacteria group bacterium]
MKRLTRQFATIAVIACQALWPALAFAQVMTSQNYRIPFDAFSGGGERSTSASYIAEDTIAEVSSPTGEDLSSASYLACVGYQCLREDITLTVNYAVQSGACDATSSSSPPYTVPLGTLTTSAVTTASNRICVRVSANSPGGQVVQIRDANAGLASNGTPADVIASNTATLVAGTAGYGVCSSNAQNGFTATTPFNGSCDTTTNHAVGALTTANQTVWFSSGFVTNAFGELLTKAAVSSVTPAHNDYQDTLTITVTATY